MTALLVASRKGAPMRRRLGFLLALAISVIAGIVASSALTHGRDEEPDSRDTAPAPNSQSIDARTANPNGGPDLGVLVYKNREGRPCLTYGEVHGNEVGVGNRDTGFRRVPVAETGNCPGVVNPVAPSVVTVADDPGTAADEGHTIVLGLALSDVAQITLQGNGVQQTAKPGPRGGFITAFDRQISGEITLEAKRTDGSTSSMTLPALPTPEELTARLRANGPTNRHAPAP